MKATFVQRGEIVDFIPDRDIAAGEVLVFRGVPGVSKIPVRRGELGALALSGIYDIEKASIAITAGDRLYWDANAKVATNRATDGFLGLAAAHAPSSAAKVRVIINFGHPDTSGGSSEGIVWQTIS